MKVLFVCGIYTDGRSNIASQFVHCQAKALKKRGVDICVLSLDMRSIRRKRKFGVNKYIIDEIPVFVSSFPCGPVKYLLKQIGVFGANSGYNKIVKNWGKPDIIHAHFHSNAYSIKNIAKNHNIPLIITEHGSTVLNQNRTIHTQRNAIKAYQSAQRMLCVSQDLKNNIQSFYNQTIDIVPNILLDYFVFSPPKYSEFSFISVGGLRKVKNFETTIRAFFEFNKKYSNSKLIIVGVGELKNQLKSLTITLGIAEKVHFTGLVDNFKLVELYNSSHCFVLPSLYETFGVVYIEAIACGLPAIATNNTKINNIVDETNGIALKNNSVPEVLNAMCEIYTNYDKYNPQKNSLICREKYGEETISNMLIKHYKELLNDQNN